MSKGIIYCAHCLVTGKKYIGQTIRTIEDRLYQHKAYSSKLDYKFYFAIRKYSFDNFIWGIVEECDISDLENKEKYWIQYFDTYMNGYNSTLGGEGGLNPKLCKSFCIEDPNGNIIEGNNIRDFCRTYNLDRSTFVKVLKGKHLCHKGYKLPSTKKVGLESMVDKKSSHYSFISPDGKVYTGKNITKFCEQMNLSRSPMFRLHKGLVKSHKGWRVA